jgi:hypothetical protein
MSQTTTIKVGESAKTITLPEGKALILNGAAGAVGMAYLLDPVLGGTNSAKTWAVGTGAPAPIGPYANSQKIMLTCSAGSIDATMQDAVLNVPTAAAAATPASTPPPLSTIARQRIYGVVSNATVNACMHEIRQAPEHYDAVKVVLTGAASVPENAFKVGVSPSAAYNDGFHPVDATGAVIAPIVGTFGSTNLTDFRNTGGGAPTGVVTGTSGQNADFTLIEGMLQTDWIPCKSLPRTDFPNRRPLIMTRIWGTNPPAVIGVAQSNNGNANPWTQIDPDYMSGYWAADYTGSTPSTPPVQSSIPSYDMLFQLRGKLCQSIAGAGDSIMQGWVQTTAVPQWGGTINGWARRLVQKIIDGGGIASYTALCQYGNKSLLFHNRAYNCLLTGGITHLLVMPWSVNEAPDGVASVPPALARTSQLIAMAAARNVKIIIVRPWAGQGQDLACFNLVQAYCDKLAASGVAVLDARAIVAADITTNAMRPEFLTKKADGTTVDVIHLNEPGHEAVAQFAYDNRTKFGLA